MLKGFVRSPWSGAVGSVLSALIGGLSWAGLIYPDNPQARLTWLGIWFAVAIVMSFWSFVTQHVKIRELEDQIAESRQERLQLNVPEPWRPQEYDGSAPDWRQHLYWVVVENVGKVPINGVRVVVVGAEPPVEHLLREALVVKGSVPRSDRADIARGGTADFDLVGELIPPPGRERLSQVLMPYAYRDNWAPDFDRKQTYRLTVRVEGGSAPPKEYTFVLGRDAEGRLAVKPSPASSTASWVRALEPR